ncbi:MAG: hypothetical protein EOM56_13185 [Deltaproteobacteria bacterium]|nr:hypothetical protein [Deltaproteobacteria bacterium]
MPCAAHSGPSHFTANSEEALGVTQARRRCLAAQGWRLASVHHADWARAHGPAARVSLLQAVLEQALLVAPPSLP